MEFGANSWSARDVAGLIHPNSNLRAHQSVGADIMDRGDGVRVFDESGKDYIECMSGLWCASLGFRNERLARAAYDQMMKLGCNHIYGHSSTEPAIALGEKLLQISPVPMSKVLFQCSGNEANETTIKLCWYHHHASGNPQRRIIIGRKAGYHGSTTGSASLSFKSNSHTDFELPYEPFRHTEFPHYYRFHDDGETEHDFATRMADQTPGFVKLVAGAGVEPATFRSRGTGFRRFHPCQHVDEGVEDPVGALCHPRGLLARRHWRTSAYSHR